jgi:hypothetical protein
VGRWVFYLTSWVGQNYLAPRQGIFRPSREDAAILVVVCAPILIAMTASHQLTPFVVVPFLAAFLLTGRLRLHFLPVLAVVLPVGWLLFAASAYFQGHVGQPPSGCWDLNSSGPGARRLVRNDRLPGGPGNRGGTRKLRGAAYIEARKATPLRAVLVTAALLSVIGISVVVQLVKLV